MGRVETCVLHVDGMRFARAGLSRLGARVLMWLHAQAEMLRALARTVRARATCSIATRRRESRLTRRTVAQAANQRRACAAFAHRRRRILPAGRALH